eukprot:g6453.t1
MLARQRVGREPITDRLDRLGLSHTIVSGRVLEFVPVDAPGASGPSGHWNSAQPFALHLRKGLVRMPVGHPDANGADQQQQEIRGPQGGVVVIGADEMITMVKSLPTVRGSGGQSRYPICIEARRPLPPNLAAANSQTQREATLTSKVVRKVLVLAMYHEESRIKWLRGLARFWLMQKYAESCAHYGENLQADIVEAVLMGQLREATIRRRSLNVGSLWSLLDFFGRADVQALLAAAPVAVVAEPRSPSSSSSTSSTSSIRGMKSRLNASAVAPGSRILRRLCLDDVELTDAHMPAIAEYLQDDARGITELVLPNHDLGP